MGATLHGFPLPNSPASVKQSVDFKANGEVSRMRAHRGNIPSLPQTKCCPLCPAKFTRTTHLNRHLRSHTNERLHRCNTCSSQFTRSDLLARHKRTCGDSISTNRSRRKSCQSCAESKIKCDLQYPCSKCSARGRQCVFINDPETSRNKKFAASRKASRHYHASKSATSTPLDNFSTLPFPNNVFPSPALSFSSNSSLDFPIAGVSPPIAINHHNVPADFSNLYFANSSGSSLSSSSSLEFLNSSVSTTPDDSPRSDFNNADFTYPLEFEADSVSNIIQLPKLFSDDTLDPFFNNIFAATQLEDPVSAIPPESALWTDKPLMDGAFTYSRPNDDLSASLAAFEDPTLFAPAVEYYSPNVANSVPAPMESATMIYNSQATTADLQNYLFLFFAAFSKQLPLIHPSTWHIEGKPPVLLRAMQACGALFVNTRSAMEFVSDTLSSTRETLVQLVATNSADLTEQTHIILALALLQTIGLFRLQKNHNEPLSPTVYHTMLITMIRRSALVYHVSSWTPTDLSDPSSLHSAWRDWANHETIKRALLLTYLHDCYHCMYSSAQPSFQTPEFSVHLPCDNALWHADSFGEWFKAIYEPSPYGSGTVRLMGVDMEPALSCIGQMRLPSVPVSQNPFANFLLIHSLPVTSFTPCGIHGPAGVRIPTPVGDSCQQQQNEIAGPEKTLPAQFALYNWLQAWHGCPEHISFPKGRNGPQFVLDVLPFHWLRQVSLLARHAGGLLSVPSTEAPDCDGISLVSCWLDQVRVSLSMGEVISAPQWKEFGNIRRHFSQVVADRRTIDSDGLLLVVLPDDE